MAKVQARPEPASESTTTTQGEPSPSSPLARKRRRNLPLVWLGFALLAVGTVTAVNFATITSVELVNPRRTFAMETLATSGIVAGRTESTVGADAQGTLVELLVDENDRVSKGQLLGRVRNRAAEGQVSQMEAAVKLAQAQFRQAKMGVAPEEVRGAESRVFQALEVLARARKSVERAQIAVNQCDAAIQAATSATVRAVANESQARSRKDLANKVRERTERLVAEGALAGARLDEARSASEVASAAYVDATAAVAVSQAQVRDAELARTSAVVAVEQARNDLNAAHSAVVAAQADWEQLKALPRAESVEVAASGVREALASLENARGLAQNADIYAPFSGTITQVLCRPGGSVSAQGVLRLVETGRLEAKADVDESHLRRLQTGQRAILITTSNPDREIDARISRISSHVEANRGTVEIVAVPTSSAVRLSPGQTVDITVVLAQNASRLMVPTSAVRRQGDQTVVFLVNEGRTVARTVRVGQASRQEVAILSGLQEGEPVVRDAGKVEQGKRVRVRR